MELKITLFFHCCSSSIPMEISVILTLVLFHCYTNENNSDFSFRNVSLLFHCFFVAVFFNTTGIPLVLLKKGNVIFIMIFETTVDIFWFQSIGYIWALCK